MPWSKLSARQLLRRFLLGFLMVQTAAIASLMATTRVRKILRGKGTAPLPRIEPRTFAVGDGNEASVYVNGAPLYEDMLSAIAQAEHRVLFESYIVKGDAMGRRFKHALIDAAERGVEVYVIYDGFANLVVKPSFFRFPPSVRVLRYPILPSGLRFLNPRNYGRDHRKILVVDDKIGFVGGYNVGELYEDEWRDTHLALSGTAVWDLENAFIDFWNVHRPRQRIAQVTRPTWEPTIRAHRNIPKQLIFPIRGMYLEAIDRAQETIELTTAYFIPDTDILDALIDASRRGVRVRILLPKVSNHVVADFLARGYFNRLLDAGVEIWRYTDHMVHAKTATIDGSWSTIGTANIDRLSLTGNYEINLEIINEEFAAGMRAVFAEDVESAERLTAEAWQGRPVVARLYEWVLKPLKPLL
ncbi:phosphatidylserine/phosphatidylglycerophosphate/cardiolipin synthase family protein [Aeromicrobium phragmitis]|uniref:Phosphatidylserine/phosphatidylglycerophosphate/ cardiolipin synthase family protein n=1 Tax=Aeromicrobium phragmitis TaxID=2478914 RepID=A0A3L8PSM9_9ACTN|nr:phospholipase D-like domain-containing protein [Aeromicrobium phragmitis]RLV56992.1 phosphatidylserine/phosphatidylglycerophosphate/cardiolipin synthase family protein [Aeromicrobium phragmitis]